MTPTLRLVLVAATASLATAYSSGVDRKALAGLWKLTPSVLSIKEFTVHPVKPPKKQDEVLLMLKVDGSFTRFETTNEEEEEGQQRGGDVDRSWKEFVSDKKKGGDPTKTLFKGTWDYRDGQLILAADRDEQKAKSDELPVEAGKIQNLFWKKGKDTILVGAVVATRNMAWRNSRLISQEESLVRNTTASSSTKDQSKQQPAPPDLSVPMGSVQVGKFFYPKNHPSFFDQPIFQPKWFGTFQLKQVLREVYAEPEEEKYVEMFRNRDFHNKRFFLTSSPIEPRRPKGNVRWSIKYNKYVEDPPSKEAKAQADAEKNRPVPIRVMKVMIHANNTFSTLAGLGDSTILRGRFSVIGDRRDQVWMQSVRFGFGRSVSGSTYSEGIALGEETKSYWGKISYEGDDDSIDMDSSKVCSKVNTDEKPKRLQVQGSVIVGWGLEPQPIAQFIMREAIDEEDFLYDNNNEEDDDDEDDGKDKKQVSSDDWSNNGNAFQ